MTKQELDIRIAYLLDAGFVIPGTTIRFGWDSIIGLIPGVGDGLTAIISLYFVFRGIQERIPLRILLVMLFHILLEWIIGSIPILGDTFDLFFKANLRNLALLQKYMKR